MPKRSDTKETVLLALELMRRIPRGRKVTATELNEQLAGAGFKRNLRTIQRQLEMLTEHFDIERDESSKPYGYSWKTKSNGFTLPVLSDQESLLLSLAQEQLRNLLPANLMRSLDGFFVQASTNLRPLTSAKKEREWLRKVRIISETQPLLAPRISPEVFAEISNALYENRWLSLRYMNVEGKSTVADVMPLGLAQQGPRMYLVVRFKGHEEERTLAVHRIQFAQATALEFQRPKDFDLERYDADGRFGFGKGERIRLSFTITEDSGRYLLESPLSLDQVATKLGKAYRIEATVVSSVQLKRWLLSFGSDISNVTTVSLKD